MKSLFHCCGKLAWIIGSLAALNVGLYPFGFDVFLTKFMMDMPTLALALRYLCLASGVMGLALLVMSYGSHCCSSAGK